MKNLGVLGGKGLQTWLPRIVGMSEAKQLIWTCKDIDVQEAYRIGLVDEVFPSGKLMEGALDLAKTLAHNPPPIMRLSKMVINASGSQDPYESLRFSAFCEALDRYMNLPHIVRKFDAFDKRSQRK